MNNVFKDFKVGTRFDLKGSTAKRSVLKENERPFDYEGVALKDNDFTKHYGNLQLIDPSKGKKEESGDPLKSRSMG